MLDNLFRRGRRLSPPAAPAVPPGAVVWAVGDIHGRRDLLEPLLAGIEADLAASPAARKIVVFLGDHIDRGPDSRGVLDRLCRICAAPELETHVLRGNHEDRMEAFLNDPEVGPGWCDFGGREALASYGVEAPLSRGDVEGWRTAGAALNAALPPAHRALLAAQVFSWTLGDYFFAHAGAEPGRPLDQQDPADLMWVRQSFLDHRAPFDRIVVHGHTPTQAVHADHRRIGLDTGAYATGVLTALRLEGAGREVLQTGRAGGRITLDRRRL